MPDKDLDRHGFTIKKYPGGAESVRKAIENAEYLCGLDTPLVQKLIKGEYSEYSTLNSLGRSSQKIIIEYDIKVPDK
tara:strand:- start:562 stop:792 length:231 start_codon:yes stop_codon:yes gene_type:complete